MTKRIFLLCIGIVFSAIVMATPAFAAWKNYDQVFMTDSGTSTTPKTDFGWNETPWLYVKLTDNASASALATNWWIIGDFEHNTPLAASFSANEYHLSLPNWNEVRKHGSWMVFADVFYDGKLPNQGNAAFFTVTPEPVSSALFLLGGVALAGTRLRRLNGKNKKTRSELTKF